MADDTLLRRDRYDPTALLSQLSGQAPGKDAHEWCFWFDAEGERIPAYLPDDVGAQENARTCLAEFLIRIRELDNSVQASFEAEYRSSQYGLDNFKLRIAWIRVDDPRITVRYWGEVVNTEYQEVFRRSGDGGWERLNVHAAKGQPK